MHTTTTIRSPAAILLGLFFAGVTAFVLFQDVIRGATITTDHVLSAAAIVAAISAGHMAWPALRSGAIIPGAMLCVLFLGATAYVVVTSGARNAETAGNKAIAIEASNATRDRELAQLARSEAMLAEAQDKLSSQCVHGRASRRSCDGIRATLAVYDAAVRGHHATLAKLPSPKAPGGYSHAARVLSSWGLAIDSDWLALNMPFITVLISELGTIAFLHLGLGSCPRRNRTKPAHPALPVEQAQRPAPQIAITERDFATDPVTDEELDELKRILGLGGLNNKTLAERLGCSAGQASKLVTAAVEAGKVSRVRCGREVRISTLH